MSRRDEVVESLDNVFTSIRRELSSALNNVSTPPSASASTAAGQRPVPLNRRLSSALASLLDGSASANGQPSTTSHHHSPTASTSRLTSVPFSGGTHEVLPLPQSPALPRRPPSSTTSSSTAPHLSARNGDGDELPSYSRRPPPATSDPSSTAGMHLPPLKLHVLTSKSRKLQLRLRARGEAHVILAQSPPAPSSSSSSSAASGSASDTDSGNVAISGSLVLHLTQPEAISFVRVRVKCCVRTIVMKIHGGGRHPVADEVVLFEEGHVLWQEEAGEVGGEVAAEGSRLPRGSINESPDPGKLQGRFEWPVELQIPARIPIPSTVDPSPSAPRTRPAPPSFVLSGASSSSSKSSSSPESASAAGIGDGGTEWASCRYYIKITLGRRGLLKLNERFIVPLIYVPCSPPPVMSPLRTLALSQGRATPGPGEDPLGWTGSRVRHTMSVRRAGGLGLGLGLGFGGGLGVGGRRGSVGSRQGSGKTWYEVALLLPAPASFARLSVLPFVVRIRSELAYADGGGGGGAGEGGAAEGAANVGSATRYAFPLGCVSAVLVQRTQIAAQGLVNTHDLIVGHALIMNDGPIEGSPVVATSSSGSLPTSAASPSHAHDAGLPASDVSATTWQRSFRGSFALSKRVGSSFRVSNLSVGYLIAVYVSVPGPGNDAEIAHGVEIVSAPAPARAPTSGLAFGLQGVSTETAIGTHSGQVQVQDPAQTGEAGASNIATDDDDDDDTLGLPPSYFDVVENDGRGRQQRV